VVIAHLPLPGLQSRAVACHQHRRRPGQFFTDLLDGNLPDLSFIRPWEVLPHEPRRGALIDFHLMGYYPITPSTEIAEREPFT
jgi:hypothetical protein